MIVTSRAKPSETKTEPAPDRPRTSIIREGFYKGHKLVVLDDGRTKYPFQFGTSKARFLVDAMNEMGPAAFRDYLAQFVAENKGKGDDDR